MKWGYGRTSRDLIVHNYPERAVEALDRRGIRRDGRKLVVIEGDSWFSIRNNIIDQLDEDRWLVVGAGQADPGDTFENMLFGTDFDSDTYVRKPVQFEAVLSLIRRRRPACFLFSGGGNDIIGPEMEMLLNHAGSRATSLVRTDALLELMDAFERGYRYMFERVWDISPGLPIITHGYGYARATGEPYAADLAGPWLKPAFVAKGVTDEGEANDAVRLMINAFNDLQSRLDYEFDDFHHLNFTDKIGGRDWQDEIHPKTRVFGRLAELFDEKMAEVIR